MPFPQDEAMRGVHAEGAPASSASSLHFLTAGLQLISISIDPKPGDQIPGLGEAINGSVHVADLYPITNHVGQPTVLDDRMEGINIATAKTRQWLVVKSDKIDALDAFAKSIFKHDIVGGVSHNEGKVMVLIKKRRNNSGCFTDIPEPELFGLLAPPGRNDATNFYVNFMKDFRQSGTKVWVNYVILPPEQNASSSSSTSLDTVIDNVDTKTKNMDSD